MTISIVTPALNPGPAIRRCIGSVRGQINVQVQHMVCDGGSTDGSIAWLATQDRLALVSEPDRGMYDAINKGWARAEGEVLAWLNADEQYLPGTLARVARAFEEDPGVSIVYGDTIVIDGHGDPLAARKEVPLRKLYVAHTFLNIYSCALFFRRTLWDCGILRFDDSYRYVGDADLVLRLLEKRTPMLKLPGFLSLFEAGRHNLSRHPNVRREAEMLRQRHGIQSSPLLGAAASSLRRLERLLRGHYVGQTVSYDYATDEAPHYRHVPKTRVTARFDINQWNPPPSTGS